MHTCCSLVNRRAITELQMRLEVIEDERGGKVAFAGSQENQALAKALPACKLVRLYLFSACVRSSLPPS